MLIFAKFPRHDEDLRYLIVETESDLVQQNSVTTHDSHRVKAVTLLPVWIVADAV